MSRDALARRIYDTAHLTGAFTLRSGATSTEYFDKYRFESDPILLRAIAEQAAERIPADTEVLAGPELGGVPVATVAVDGAANAGVLAVQILAVGDPDLRKKLHEYKQQLAEGLRL